MKFIAVEGIITSKAGRSKVGGRVSDYVLGVNVSSDWRRALLFLLINVCSLVAFGMIAFRANEAHLFFGLDGSEMMTYVRQQRIWMPAAAGFTNNFFQSMGNVWFPLNTHLIPGYLLPKLFAKGALDPVLAYVVFSVELFLSAYLASLWLRLGDKVAAFSAWALVLAALPYWGFGKLYPMFMITPHLSTVMLMMLVILVMLQEVGKRSRLVSFLCLFGIADAVAYVGLSQAIFIAIVAPVLIGLGIGVLADSKNKQEVAWKLGGIAVVAGLLVVSGVLPFLYGLHRYTAAFVFKSELLNQRQTWYDVSVLFQNGPWGAAGQVLWGGALAGGVIFALMGTGLKKYLAIAMLVMMVALVGFGALTMHVNFWQGPVPLYVEMLLWPLFAVYAMALLGLVGELGMRVIRNRINYRAGLWVGPATLGWEISTGLLIAVLPWGMLASVHATTLSKERDYPFPPRETPILTTLQNEVGLTPGGLFRGRVATFTGQSLPGGVNWIDLHMYDASLIKKYGNDHRTVGLWYFDIPTLFEYNQFLTPPYYLVTRTFLARPDDRQMRNIMVLRNIEPRVLRMMGVRFLITDEPVENDVRLRRELQRHDQATLLLYELDGANLGHYSPTEVVLASSAHDAIAAMSSPGFDPVRKVVVDAPLPSGLVPASSGKLFVAPGSLRLSAKSKGTSLLVLPLEYSHCLELRSLGGKETVSRLVRADLLQTGIVFSGQLEATITFFVGPFRNAWCRIEDARDVDRLDFNGEVRPMRTSATS
jgi:hypothetical protein